MTVLFVIILLHEDEDKPVRPKGPAHSVTGALSAINYRNIIVCTINIGRCSGNSP